MAKLDQEEEAKKELDTALEIFNSIVPLEGRVGSIDEWTTRILIIGLCFGLADEDLPQVAPRDNMMTNPLDDKHVNSSPNLFYFSLWLYAASLAL